MKKHIIHFAGWPSITNVACPIPGCCGIVRWAEAGYVPGYRICDGTTRHHFELRDDALTPNGRTERGYRTRAIRAAAVAAAQRDDAQRRDTFGRDKARQSRTILGIRVDACCQCGRETLAAERAEMRRLEPELFALAEQIKSVLPACSSLLDVFRDGTCHIYRERNERGLFGGTCVLRTDSVLSLPPGGYFSCSEDFEAACGGAVCGYKTATGYLPDGTIAAPLPIAA